MKIDHIFLKNLIAFFHILTMSDEAGANYTDKNPASSVAVEVWHENDRSGRDNIILRAEPAEVIGVDHDKQELLLLSGKRVGVTRARYRCRL